MGKLAVAVITSLWVIPISILVNYIVPDPYMDEIFHVPQAQQYCKGNFWNWDPMITTPPGLYVISLLHVACLFPSMFILGLVSSFSELCSTSVLRSTNGVWAVLCSVLVYEIVTHLRPTISERIATLLAVVLSLYPLHWFFTFLYYTDVPSLTVVLAMYLACLKKKYYSSALFGAFAVFMRQTNIIWVVFVACTGVIEITIGQQRRGVKVVEFNASPDRTGRINVNSRLIAGSNMRRRKPSSPTDVCKNKTFNISIGSTGLLREIYAILLTSWYMRGRLLFLFSPFLLVLLAFVAFVKWNGSVVLGAKDAHAVSVHFAQMLYFGLISVIAMAPLHFSIGHFTDLSRSFWRNRPLSFCLLLVAISLGFLFVHFFSLAHPYLIADNRHYTFYLWRKVIKAHWLMKYLLVPLYVYSWFSICYILGKVREKLWVLAYFLATAAVLIPAPLIEFRYYTIPLYLLALHSPINQNRNWILIGLGCVVVNAFTMWMFLFRPFSWSHEPGVQRFIW